MDWLVVDARQGLGDCPRCGGLMEHDHGYISDFVCRDCGWPENDVRETPEDTPALARRIGDPQTEGE